MSPPTQNALVVTEVGRPVSLTTIPVPQPGPSQVQIRVTVAGLNPHDQKARDTGLFIANNLPAIVGNDVVGEVTVLGSQVSKYAVGDHIVGHAGFSRGSAQNALQEYAVVDADFSAQIPPGFSDDDGATLPTNAIAPLVALFDPTALNIPAPWTSAAVDFDYAATSLLVLGGGSNCGRFGVQLAALAGIGRIVVVGGDETELKALGATHIVDRHGSPAEVVARVRDIVGDELVYAYDAINPPATQTIGINALSSTKRGHLARLLPTGDVDASHIQPKTHGYELHNVFGSSQARAELCRPFWERVPQYLADKKIVPTGYAVVQGLDPVKVNEVLDAYRDGKRVTKPHVHVG